MRAAAPQASVRGHDRERPNRRRAQGGERRVVELARRAGQEGDPGLRRCGERAGRLRARRARGARRRVDNDGTLWCEKPVPIQMDVILRRFVEMARADPSLRERQPWKAASEKDHAWFATVMA